MDKNQVSHEECMYQSLFNLVQLCRINIFESEIWISIDASLVLDESLSQKKIAIVDIGRSCKATDNCTHYIAVVCLDDKDARLYAPQIWNNLNQKDNYSVTRIFWSPNLDSTLESATLLIRSVLCKPKISVHQSEWIVTRLSIFTIISYFARFI